MGGRINTVMQVCFFAISGVLPHDEAIAAIKDSIRKTYGKKGEEIVQMNLDGGGSNARASCTKSKCRTRIGSDVEMRRPVPDEAPAFVRDVLGADDRRPRRRAAGERAAVRRHLSDRHGAMGEAQPGRGNSGVGPGHLHPVRQVRDGLPARGHPQQGLRTGRCSRARRRRSSRSDARLPEWKGLKYTLQVAPEDCTGCGICVDVCPARNKSRGAAQGDQHAAAAAAARERSARTGTSSSRLPELDRRQHLDSSTCAQQQVQQPLFEFSGACAGCGETPYLKLLTQLFGDRLLVANATGCSSIYGGNLPTTPWTQNAEGRGPAWCNSLFEDNAEFGLGFRVSLDKQREFAARAAAAARAAGRRRSGARKSSTRRQQRRSRHLRAARARRRAEAPARKRSTRDDARQLLALADALVRKSVWIVGGDGWAYDIGFGGLDHVLASGRNVKVLVLDTEVYSNTGGQMSKATPRGAVAKFAAGGKRGAKKDLGLMAMTYGNIYVACVAMGAKDEHTLKAFLEAEAYDGPALIIAYSHCIAHGIDMTTAMQNQKAAVQLRPVAALPLQSRPRRSAARIRSSSTRAAPRMQGRRLPRPREPLQDARPRASRTTRDAACSQQAQDDVDARWALYQYLAARASKLRLETHTKPSHEPHHHLSRPEAAHAARAVGLAAFRRPRQHQAHGGRGRVGGRAFTRCSKSRFATNVTSCTTTSRRARRAIAEALTYFPEPRRVPVRAGSATCEHIAKAKAGGRHSDHRQPQRLDLRRLDEHSRSRSSRPAPTRWS